MKHEILVSIVLGHRRPLSRLRARPVVQSNSQKRGMLWSPRGARPGVCRRVRFLLGREWGRSGWRVARAGFWALLDRMNANAHLLTDIWG